MNKKAVKTGGIEKTGFIDTDSGFITGAMEVQGTADI